MSRAAKLTLAFSSIFAVATTVGVYYMAENDKDALKNGPVKDAARLEKRRQRELTSKQQYNLNDFEAQKKLREQLESQQPLTGEITQGKDKN